MGRRLFFRKKRTPAVPTAPLLQRLAGHARVTTNIVWCRAAYVVTNWILSTNHRRIATMYFSFVLVTGFAGLALATLIRIELAYPGQVFMINNAERYLTIISLHGIIMVFFVVIPVLFGAFGNFLLPTQLGVRDVAFPRLNSIMFWVTPGGFVMLLHILVFDRMPSMMIWSGRPPRHSAELRRGEFTVSGVEWTSSVIGRIAWGRKHEPSTKIVWNPSHLQTQNTVSGFYPPAGGAHWAHLGKFGLRFGATPPPARNSLEGGGASTVLIMRLAGRVWDLAKLGHLPWIAPAGTFRRTSAIQKMSSWQHNLLLPGWAFITPYSSRLRFSGLGKVDVALIVVFSISLGSVLSSVNYVVTYRCVGSPTMGSRRELRSFFVDALLVGSRMMILANPALLIGIALLLSDRHFGTSVFDFSGGGDTVLFQHLFWFFGHPEVYIIIIPCFGFANSLFPHLLRKRLSGRLSLQYSMYTIGFMGFAVWGHHMYMVGLSNTTRTLYSTMTVMISVPASTKVLHWCVTMSNAAPLPDISFWFLLSFTYFFVLGGLSGMFVAHIGFDILFHDTFYVIGHFHVMLSGAAVSCIFAAFYYYFGSIAGVKYSRPFAALHLFFYFWGQVINLGPMFWLGYSGMPRRVMDYPTFFGGWHGVSSGGHILSVIGFGFFLLALMDSWWLGYAPASRPLGVSRVNTRLSFYAYQSRKLAGKGELAATLLDAPSTQMVISPGDWFGPLESRSMTYDLNFRWAIMVDRIVQTHPCGLTPRVPDLGLRPSRRHNISASAALSREGRSPRVSRGVISSSAGAVSSAVAALLGVGGLEGPRRN